jgi:hypothetical protein
MKAKTSLIGVLLLLTPLPAQAADFVRGPWLQNVTPDGITVVWEASEEESTTPTVSWGLTAAHELGSVDATHASMASIHVYSARIEGLSADTIHHYKVAMGTSETLDATFKTAPAVGTTGFRFYALGDNRSNPSDWGRICTQIHEDMSEHPEHNQTFILNTGDLAGDGSVYEDWDQLWPPAQIAVRELPMFVAFGNHEDRNTPTSDALIYGYFDNPHTESGSTDEKWYSFDYGNVHFSSIAIYDDTGYRSGDQHDWLAADLDAAQHDSLTTLTFAMMHFLPWSLGSHGYSDASSLRDYIHPLLRDEDVSLAFGGHNHIYARYAPIDGVVYITTGGAGAGLHTEYYDAWTGGTLESYAQVHHHLIVDVEGTTFTVRAIDTLGELLDYATYGGTDIDHPPFADAGASQTSIVDTLVTLDGSASEDPEGTTLTYEWTQISGPELIVAGADTAHPSFTPAYSGRYLFELRVSDGVYWSTPDFTTARVHAGVLTFNPVADTFIDRSNPSVNYGTSETLQLDLGPEYNPDDTQHAYLRFEVAGVDGHVSTATLRLYCGNSGSPVQIHTSSDTTWLEEDPTWDAPLVCDGPLAGLLHSPTTDAWAEADVTPAVTGNGLVTFVLLPTGTDGADFTSRESPTPPELVITYDSEEPEDPTCSIIADRTDILVDETVRFTAVASASTGHTISSREWDFDHDMFTFDTDATGEETTHTFTAGGSFIVALRVTDDAGLTCISTIGINVTGPEPLPDETPDENGSSSARGCGCSLVH